MKNTIQHLKGQTLYAFGMALFICLSFSISAQAQRPEKAFGIGFQAGNPSGLALQFFRDHGVSTDILLAYNLDDFLFLNMHALWQTHLDQKNMTHLFYGPGGFIGLRDVDNNENNFDEFEAGISGNVGLNLIVKRVEFFGQITPRFSLIPSTQFNWGGGVGIRFYI